MPPQERREENKPSKQLRKDQNQKLFSLVGNRCTTLASAVVQVYLADGKTWRKKTCGVGCLIKDNPKRSYFIRVYDLKTNNVLWEQEIYNQFKYKTPKDLFHTFESDDCVAGLNFSDKSDASYFKSTVLAKQNQRSKRRKDRNSQRNSTSSTKSKGSETKSSKSSKQNSKLSKEKIGEPKHFRHVGHVGWDPSKGFSSMNDLDPDLKFLFETVGITEKELHDNDTAAFIYDFIEKHGGVEALKQSHRETLFAANSPPPVFAANSPPSSLPPRQRRSSDAPPPLPGRDRKLSLPNTEPLRDARTFPRSPTTPDFGRSPPAPARQKQAAPPPPTMNTSPPPLPPGRRSSPSSAPPAPSPGRQGHGRHKSEPRHFPSPTMSAPQTHATPPPMAGPPPPPPMGAPAFSSPAPPAPAPASSGRSNLLADIQRGKNLKRIERDSSAPKSSSSASQGGMADLLKQAMDSRTIHIHGNDDSEDDDYSDDDDWDD